MLEKLQIAYYGIAIAYSIKTTEVTFRLSERL